MHSGRLVHLLMSQCYFSIVVEENLRQLPQNSMDFPSVVSVLLTKR